MESKRTRSRNFTESEKNMLFEIVTTKYKHIIENKETDAITLARKNLAWQEITQTFNSQSQTGHRSAKQLHALYDGMKKSARSNLFTDKKEAYKTGGGTFTPKSSALDEKIVSVLRPQFEPLQNRYDSSASYLEPQAGCSKDAETIHIEEIPIIFESVPTTGTDTEASDTANVETRSDLGTPVPSPEAVQESVVESPDLLLMGRKRKAKTRTKASVQVSKRKSALEALSNRFARRKNAKDAHDEQLHEKRLEILDIEKQTKLKQLETAELQRKLAAVNYEARLEEIAFEKKIREQELKNLEK